MRAWCVGAGQERSIIPAAQHTACTIEMTNLLKRVDVAVIDEIQVGSAAPAFFYAHCSDCPTMESWQLLRCWSTLP